MLLRRRERDLRRLVQSFVGEFGAERIADLENYVDHCEPGLAIELLSDWIYDENVLVSIDQEKAILKSSDDYGVDSGRHSFIGRQPPYPDLRTPEQIAESEMPPTIHGP